MAGTMSGRELASGRPCDSSELLRLVLTFDGGWVSTSPPLDDLFAGIFLNTLREGTPRVIHASAVPAETEWPSPVAEPGSEQPHSPWEMLRIVFAFEGEWRFTSPPLDATFAGIFLNLLRDGPPHVSSAKVVPAETEWPPK